jgi:hypothetical protein
MKLGAQTQATPGSLESFVRDTQPAVWKLFGTALDLGVAQTIKRVSPRTFVIGRVAARLDEGFDRPREQALAFAAAALQEYERFRGLLDAVEGINEPIVKDADTAKRLNEWQVVYSQQMNAHAWPVVAYNFNTGGPEVFNANGEIDPAGGMWQYLHDGLRASQYLGLHEYGAPTIRQKGDYLTLRYRAVWFVLPPNCRIPILMTECGLDFGLIGKSPSGFMANGVSVPDYMQQLAGYNVELERDPYVAGACVFLFGSGAAQWDTFDVAGDDARPAFASLLKSSRPIPVPPPAAGPPGDTMTPYSFPQNLTDIGAMGEEGTPMAGLPFYRLTGSAVRRGVSAFLVVTVLGPTGVPLTGVTVVNMFPDGNGEIVQTDGSGVARFQFGASSAFTTPGTGPFRVLLADEATKDDTAIPKKVTFKNKLSDAVRSLGDFQAVHTEIYLQFTQQPAGAPPPPPPGGLPVVTAPLDAGVRSLAWMRRGIDFNPDAALYKRARALQLGYPLSGEFGFKDESGRVYVAQLFAGGITYCVVGDYGNIKVVSWL